MTTPRTIPHFRPICTAVRVRKNADHGDRMPVSLRVEPEADRRAFILHHSA